jgi:hypothetical protein
VSQSKQIANTLNYPADDDILYYVKMCFCKRGEVTKDNNLELRYSMKEIMEFKISEVDVRMKSGVAAEK